MTVETMQLEDLRPRCAVRGVHPDGVVTVVSVQWFGSEALELTYKTPAGTVANELLYRHDEARLEVVAQGRPWSFDGDGALFRLVSEAQRIRLAHLFDPCWRSTPRWSTHYRIRPPPSTRRCCRASRCASCSPTTPAPARPSWPGC